jgi:hypothetical protein
VLAIIRRPGAARDDVDVRRQTGRRSSAHAAVHKLPTTNAADVLDMGAGASRLCTGVDLADGHLKNASNNRTFGHQANPDSISHGDS